MILYLLSGEGGVGFSFTVFNPRTERKRRPQEATLRRHAVVMYKCRPDQTNPETPVNRSLLTCLDYWVADTLAIPYVRTPPATAERGRGVILSLVGVR